MARSSCNARFAWSLRRSAAPEYCKGRYTSGSDPTLTSLRYLPWKNLPGLNSIFPGNFTTMDSYFVGLFFMRPVEFRSQVMMAQGATITRDR
jgi:hypothetical protein